MPNLRAIVSLGQISHNAVLRALGKKLSAHKFGHASEYDLDGVTLLSSYHTSRYNINTGVLKIDMFDAVIARAKQLAGD